ncbi:HalOD1 output domain-containing protein [Halosolutus halophilus]|uniref:HalOD1 output domain-containing protein n=1 Tax=Halosolutus halophilus TaxID=1552990 RepID=UPI0022352CB7|nr:HalOD1 output domain-containing protein [Halosolutus halophilus]
MSGYTPPAPQSRSPSVYRAVHDPEGTATLSTTVIHALADCTGVDVTDCRFSLYDAVDPDALDALFRPRHDGRPRTGGRLSFVVDDHYVTVTSDGEILIEPPESDRYAPR